MIRRPAVCERKGKKPVEVSLGARAIKGKRTIAFQSSLSVTGSSVLTQDSSVETESSWREESSFTVSASTQEAFAQTSDPPFPSYTELYAKLLQKSEKIVSLERALNEALRKCSEKEDFTASLQLEAEQLKGSLHRAKEEKETVKQTCVRHLGRVEDKLGELERNKSALEGAAAARKEGETDYETLLAALRSHNYSLAKQVKDAETRNEALKIDILSLQEALNEAKRETNSLHYLRSEASLMLSEREALEKRLSMLQSRLDQRKSQVKELTRELHLKDLTFQDLQRSCSALQARLQLFQQLSHS